MNHRSVLLVTGAAALSLPCFAAAQWTRVNTAAAPSARSSPAMAYDAVRRNTVLFSGYDPTVPLTGVADTWIYDGVTWRQVFPATSPTSRASCPMVFDSVRGRCVIYGGGGPVNAPNPSRETWEWNGTNWTQAFPANNPGSLRAHAMAYDATRRRVVLYGGIAGGLAANNLTWEYDGVNWRRITTASTPGPRAGAAMCYDTVRRRVVLFGGVDPFTGGLPGTWVYNGVNWTQLAVSGPTPPLREAAAMVYDPARRVCVLYGGFDVNVCCPAGVHDDTWEFDGAAWTQVGISTSSPRLLVGMVQDLTRRRTVVFGGSPTSVGQTAVDETWEYSGFVRTFGAGCSGTAGVPTLTSTSIPRRGTTLNLDLQNLSNNPGVAVLYIGYSNVSWNGTPLPLNLTPAGYTGCTLYVSLDSSTTLPVSGGTARWSWLVPTSTEVIGVSFFAQGAALDPLANQRGVVFTNAAAIVIGS